MKNEFLRYTEVDLSDRKLCAKSTGVTDNVTEGMDDTASTSLTM